MAFDLSGVDWVGYFAAGLVLATFCMRDMQTLRCTAVASNLAFITYGAMSGMGPVLALHLLLLPINVMHLLTWARQQPASRARAAARGGIGCKPEQAHHE